MNFQSKNYANVVHLRATKLKQPEYLPAKLFFTTKDTYARFHCRLLRLQTASTLRRLNIITSRETICKEVVYMVMDYYPQTLYGYCKRTIWRFGIQKREQFSSFVIKQLAEGL